MQKNLRGLKSSEWLFCKVNIKEKQRFSSEKKEAKGGKKGQLRASTQQDDTPYGLEPSCVITKDAIL